MPTEAKLQYFKQLHETLQREKKFSDVIKRMKIDKPKIINPDIPFFISPKGKR